MNHFGVFNIIDHSSTEPKTGNCAKNMLWSTTLKEFISYEKVINLIRNCFFVEVDLLSEDDTFLNRRLNGRFQGVDKGRMMTMVIAHDMVFGENRMPYWEAGKSTQTRFIS